MPLQEGFVGQRMASVPLPAMYEALDRPVTRRLVVSDIGIYPNAGEHRMERPTGASQMIVLLCTAGIGWVRIGDVTHRLPAMSAAVIPLGVPHAYGSTRHTPWTVWWVHLRGSDLDEIVAATGATLERPTLPVRRTDRANALCDEIISGMERDQSPARILAATGAAWHLVTQISVDRAMPEPGDPLQRAMTYLEERLDATVQVPELAKLIGVSASHLGARFREATGGGVLAYHTGLRMARARLLLDTTPGSVTDIAAELGYEDAFYFSRRFRKHHGMSPTAFRDRER